MADLRQDRPLIVLIDPKWNFQQDEFEIDRFFEEAKITEENITVLRGRFYKFCSRDGPIGTGDPYLTPEDFHRLNKHYAICRAEEEACFFSAMDRSGGKQLFFDEFLLGCSAANPATPHILNSFTGYVRARYIFDFYNVSRSGSLEFEELAKLLSDTRRHLGEELDAQRKHATEIAQELGEVSALTLRVVGLNGPLCDLRVSTRWTGRKVRREIARELQVPIDGQELVIGTERFLEGDVLEKLVATGDDSINVSVVLSWDRWPCEPEAQISDGISGVERLVHVSFDAFYKALTAEQLRGTSRLFRFHRQILHLRSRAGAAFAAAAAGGA